MFSSYTKFVITLFFLSCASDAQSVDWQVGSFFNASITLATATHFFDIKRKEEPKKFFIPNLLCSMVGSALISTLLYEEKHGINYLPFLRNENTRILKKIWLAVIYLILQNGLKQSYRDETFIEFIGKQLIIGIAPFFCALDRPKILLKNPFENILNHKKKAV